MGSHSASGCQDTFCSNHTSQVFRRSLQSYQDSLCTVSYSSFRIGCIEVDLSCCSTRGSRQTLGQLFSFLQFFCIEHRVKQLVDLSRFNTHNSRFLVDQTFALHVNCDLNGSRSSSLAVSCLQHEQFVSFYCELHVLHVCVVLFEEFCDSCEFCIYFRESLSHFSDRLRSTDTSNNVFALCVYQEFTEDRFFTVDRASCEGYACTGCFSHVTEYHGLYIYCSTDAVRDLIELSVKDSSVIVPGAEYSHDCFHQLILWFLREVPSHFFLNESLVSNDDFL